MGTKNRTNGKPTCFVVMGFGKKTDFETGRVLDLDMSYQNMIKPAVEAAGLTCERADEITHAGVIDVLMYEKLLKADVVVADLSTSNKNAFYELGIRHALRPFTTVIIAEDGIKTFPFDVNRVVVRQYHHLGEDIGAGEVKRFGEQLTKALREIMARDPRDKDSPVYTFLNGLVPPSLEEQVTKTMKQVEKALRTAPAGGSATGGSSTQPDRDNKTLAVLIEKGEQAIRTGKFEVAKAMFSQTLETGMESGSKHSRVTDPYLIQRLAIATYKAEQPGKVAALDKALELLEERFNLEVTNDSETLGIAGAIKKHLFEEEKDKKKRIEHLNKSIDYYSRGYYLRNDYYNGISLAYMLNVRTDTELDAKNEEKIADLVHANRLRQHVLELCEEKLKVLNGCEQDVIRHGAAESNAFRKKQLAGTREQKFWVTARKAEAYYGLGNMPAYEKTKAEAESKEYAAWMVKSFRGQINKLKILLGKHGHLLSPPWPEIPMAARQ